jgi:rhodanese-related sulfurtransferase
LGIKRRKSLIDIPQRGTGFQRRFRINKNINRPALETSSKTIFLQRLIFDMQIWFLVVCQLRTCRIISKAVCRPRRARTPASRQNHQQAIRKGTSAVRDQCPRSLTPQGAYQMLHEHPQTMLVDIRSSMEFLYVGHPIGAVHVPWIDEPNWQVNPDFASEIVKLLDSCCRCPEESKSIPIILICRSGKRSQEAGQKLLEMGLRNVFHVDEGFEGELDAQQHRGTLGGWRFRGLPWEQI